jgi:ribosomal protein S18 acetylase RimI-like enzyme
MLIRRPADPTADFEVLFALRESGFRDHVERVYGRWDDAEQRRHLANDLAEAPYEIVEDGAGEPIGCVAVTKHADHDFVEDIIIVAALRGRGLGTRLMYEFMDDARARGVPLRLSVLDGNPVRALYERLGFRVTLVVPPRTKLEWP